MALILSIETSASVCSVALSENEKIISLKESGEVNSHASILGTYIEEIFKENAISGKNIDAVAVSKGPGSYTGLRIGVSTAKGLCYAGLRPLISISTLQTIVYGLMKGDRVDQSLFDSDALFCPMIDARRMEVYTALFDQEGTPVSEVTAQIINADSFNEILTNKKVVFFGNGAAKCKNLIVHSNAFFIDHVNPSARYMAELAAQAYIEKKFENVAYFEPFYLKDFVTTVSKKKIF
jgi:tRNA threonylcarbamoyladenosine biosynthesis protein TsaB